MLVYRWSLFATFHYFQKHMCVVTTSPTNTVGILVLDIIFVIKFGSEICCPCMALFVKTIYGRPLPK